MPSYEFRCLNCKRRFEVYLPYSEYGKQASQCPHCNSENVQRRIGRIRFARSEESRLEGWLIHPNWLAWRTSEQWRAAMRI
jgi:putative FmdB family regulatory protein